MALAWTAHDPHATNLRLADLELVDNVRDALRAANRAGTPVQNFVAADDQGHVGWTLMGQVPIRANYDSTVPRPGAQRARGGLGGARQTNIRA